MITQEISDDLIAEFNILKYYRPIMYVSCFLHICNYYILKCNIYSDYCKVLSLLNVAICALKIQRNRLFHKCYLNMSNKQAMDTIFMFISIEGNIMQKINHNDYSFMCLKPQGFAITIFASDLMHLYKSLGIHNHHDLLIMQPDAVFHIYYIYILNSLNKYTKHNVINGPCTKPPFVFSFVKEDQENCI